MTHTQSQKERESTDSESGRETDPSNQATAENVLDARDARLVEINARRVPDPLCSHFSSLKRKSSNTAVCNEPERKLRRGISIVCTHTPSSTSVSPLDEYGDIDTLHADIQTLDSTREGINSGLISPTDGNEVVLLDLEPKQSQQWRYLNTPESSRKMQYNENEDIDNLHADIKALCGCEEGSLSVLKRPETDQWFHVLGLQRFQGRQGTHENAPGCSRHIPNDDEDIDTLHEDVKVLCANGQDVGAGAERLEDNDEFDLLDLEPGQRYQQLAASCDNFRPAETPRGDGKVHIKSSMPVCADTLLVHCPKEKGRDSSSSKNENEQLRQISSCMFRVDENCQTKVMENKSVNCQAKSEVLKSRFSQLQHDVLNSCSVQNLFSPDSKTKFRQVQEAYQSSLSERAFGILQNGENVTHHAHGTTYTSPAKSRDISIVSVKPPSSCLCTFRLQRGHIQELVLQTVSPSQMGYNLDGITRTSFVGLTVSEPDLNKDDSVGAISRSAPVVLHSNPVLSSLSASLTDKSSDDACSQAACKNGRCQEISRKGWHSALQIINKNNAEQACLNHEKNFLDKKHFSVVDCTESCRRKVLDSGNGTQPSTAVKSNTLLGETFCEVIECCASLKQTAKSNNPIYNAQCPHIEHDFSTAGPEKIYTSVTTQTDVSCTFAFKSKEQSTFEKSCCNANINQMAARVSQPAAQSMKMMSHQLNSMLSNNCKTDRLSTQVQISKAHDPPTWHSLIYFINNKKSLCPALAGSQTNHFEFLTSAHAKQSMLSSDLKHNEQFGQSKCCLQSPHIKPMNCKNVSQDQRSNKAELNGDLPSVYSREHRDFGFAESSITQNEQILKSIPTPADTTCCNETNPLALQSALLKTRHDTISLQQNVTSTSPSTEWTGSTDTMQRYARRETRKVEDSDSGAESRVSANIGSTSSSSLSRNSISTSPSFHCAKICKRTAQLPAPCLSQTSGHETDTGLEESAPDRKESIRDRSRSRLRKRRRRRPGRKRSSKYSCRRSASFCQRSACAVREYTRSSSESGLSSQRSSLTDVCDRMGSNSFESVLSAFPVDPETKDTWIENTGVQYNNLLLSGEGELVVHSEGNFQTKYGISKKHAHDVSVKVDRNVSISEKESPGIHQNGGCNTDSLKSTNSQSKSKYFTSVRAGFLPASEDVLHGPSILQTHNFSNNTTAHLLANAEEANNRSVQEESQRSQTNICRCLNAPFKTNAPSTNLFNTSRDAESFLRQTSMPIFSYHNPYTTLCQGTSTKFLNTVSAVADTSQKTQLNFANSSSQRSNENEITNDSKSKPQSQTSPLRNKTYVGPFSGFGTLIPSDMHGENMTDRVWVSNNRCTRTVDTANKLAARCVQQQQQLGDVIRRSGCCCFDERFCSRKKYSKDGHHKNKWKRVELYRRARELLKQLVHIKTKEEILFRAAIRFQFKRLQIQEMHSRLVREARTMHNDATFKDRDLASTMSSLSVLETLTRTHKSGRCQHKRRHLKCHSRRSESAVSNDVSQNHSRNMASTRKVSDEHQHPSTSRADDGTDTKEDTIRENKESFVSQSGNSHTMGEKKNKKRKMSQEHRTYDDLNDDVDDDCTSLTSFSTHSYDEEEEEEDDDDENNSENTSGHGKKRTAKNKRSSSTRKKSTEELSSQSTDDDSNDPRVAGFFRTS